MPIHHPHRRGVTLIELLIVMMILVVLGALTMSAIGNLGEQARIERTKTIIKRIDKVLQEKWNSYLTRPLPIRIPPHTAPPTVALIRLRAVRDLMRMELPERASDVDARICSVTPVNLTLGTGLSAMSLAPSASFARYTRIVSNTPATWATTNASPECLYLILSGTRDGETTALDFLSPSEIGDTDGDGMKEILDAWGQPIFFWRWAPGYVNDLNVTAPVVAISEPHVPGRPVYLNTLQDRNSPDPFDPHRADPQLNDVPNPPASPALASPSFALRPLVVSAGPDRVLDLVTDGERRYAATTDAMGNANRFFQNNPFPSFNDTATSTHVYEAQPYDFANDGPEWYDNLTNHYVETP